MTTKSNGRGDGHAPQKNGPIKPAAPSASKADDVLVLFDNIFKFIEGIAFVFWMLYEFFGHKILLYLAIVFCLAGLFYLLAHKILKRITLIFTVWVIYAALCVLLFKARPNPEPNEYPRFMLTINTADSPTVNLAV